jgi:hypothetical protein
MMILRRIIFAGLLLLVVNAVPCAFAADLLSKFSPYISIKEEYRDNITFASTDKKDDYITTIQPGIKFSNKGETSGIDLDYSLGAVYYGKNTDFNYISHTGSLDVKYLTKEHINFYLRDSFIKSNYPREREYFTTDADNKYALATVVDGNTYTRNVLAPTIEYQFGPENKLGVNYRNNVYRTQSVVAQDSQEDFISPFFNYWFNKQNGISLDYGYTAGRFQTTPNMIAHRGNARYTNRFSEKSSAFAEYSFTRRTFDAPDRDYDLSEPKLGIIYTLPTFTVTAQAGYYWKDPIAGDKSQGYSYLAELKNLDPRTTYQLSLQGGYTESYFSAQNLGFMKYKRLTGSVTHLLAQRTSINCSGSIEQVDYGTQNGTPWSITGGASHMPLKWLKLALELSHRQYPLFSSSTEVTVNSGMFIITATYD